VFAIALNYREHAREAGRELPTMPGVFTKFPTCLVGPRATVHLPTETVDWEVELVVVMGARAEQVKEARAWDHVAGLCVGQDISERVLQLGGTFPQLALAKSMPGFGPLGPAVVTPDELTTPDDLALSCSVTAVVQQSARTSDMVFGVPELISRISAICPLLPGDLIFTGTPQGVGGSRTPPEYLHDGDVLVSEIEGIGTLRNVLTSQRQPMMGMAL
jgi:2-keto-4-pentenoate hydratase/2-oxohepta-3-ene-1,7-dioic acid hydratase in catechol pathway